jgi:hypothetical protein
VPPCTPGFSEARKIGLRPHRAGRRRHQDGFLQAPQFEHHVHRNLGRRTQAHRLLHEFLEARQLDRDGVRPDRQVGKHVESGRIRHGGSVIGVAFVGHRDRRAGYRRLLQVADESRDVTRIELRSGGRRECRGQRKEHESAHCQTPVEWRATNVPLVILWSHVVVNRRARHGQRRIDFAAASPFTTGDRASHQVSERHPPSRTSRSSMPTASS